MTEKEKFEEAKRLYQTANADRRYVLERLFPELNECKDERIWEALIKFHKSTIAIYGIDGEDIVTWLEKQAKKTVWTDNDRIMASTLMRDVDQITYINEEGKNKRLEWLNSLEDRFNKEK